MARRIILAAAALAVATGGLLIYRLVSRTPIQPYEQELEEVDKSNETEVEKTEEINILQTGPVGVGQAKGLYFATRDNKGNIVREFGCEKRVASEEGIFEISRPWVKFYTQNQKIIEITAERGSMPLEVTAGQMKLPASGYVEGDVQIQMYDRQPNEPTGDKEPPTPDKPDRPREMLVKLERLDFQQEFSQITSNGKVEITSSEFFTQGSGLTVQYDQLQNRFQFLELLEVKQLGLKSSILQTREKTSAEGKIQETDSDAIENKEGKNNWATYRLTMTDEVVIRQQEEKLTADNIEIIADVDRFGVLPDESAKAKSTQTQSKQTIQTIESKTGSEPVDMPEQQLTYITCKGPLQITSLDTVGPTSAKPRLVFTANGRPTQVWRQNELVCEADTLQYSRELNTIKLTAEEDRPVKLLWAQGQQATAQREVQFNQESRRASLYGPGEIDYAEEGTSAKSVIVYQNEVNIQFAAAIDEGLGQLGQQPLWLEFVGGVQVNDADGKIEMGKLRIAFYETEKSAKKQQPLVEKIEFFDTFQAESAGRRFSGDNLQAYFGKCAAGRSQLKRVLAQGKVDYEDPNYLVQADEKIELVFADSMSESPAKPARQEGTDEGGRQSEAGLNQLLSGGKVKYVTADGAGGGVKVTNKKDKYQIIGDRAEADQLKKTWSIKGEPARVVGLAEQGQLEGPMITADLNENLISIKGQGTMDRKIEVEPNAPPMDMHVAWQEGVTYNIKGDKITMHQATARLIQQQQPERWESELACPIMTVDMTSSARRMTLKNEQENKGEAADKSLAKLTKLTAEGPAVKIVRKVYGNIDDELLNKTEIQAKKVEFNNTDRRITAKGEGWIEFIDYQSAGREREKQLPATKNTPPKTIGGAIAEQAAEGEGGYLFVHYLDEMQAEIDGGRLCFTGGVAVHQLPYDAATVRKGEINVPGARHLYSQEISLTRMPEKNRLGSDGKEIMTGWEGSRPGKVRAAGDVVLEIITRQGTQHIFFGDSLDYDGASQAATVHGSDNRPVRFDQMQFPWVEYNLATGSFQTPWSKGQVAGEY